MFNDFLYSDRYMISKNIVDFVKIYLTRNKFYYGFEGKNVSTSDCLDSKLKLKFKHRLCWTVFFGEQFFFCQKSSIQGRLLFFLITDLSRSPNISSTNIFVVTQACNKFARENAKCCIFSSLSQGRSFCFRTRYV